MIVKLKQGISQAQIQQYADELQAVVVNKPDGTLLVTPSKLQELPAAYQEATTAVFPMDSDIQLASKSFINGVREINFGNFAIGGSTKNTVVITGPCSVESKEQITQAAELCIELGVKVLRAGAYKPRTSPYSFQGMGLDGLKLLRETGDKYGLKVITEVRDATHIDDVIALSDIVQIGAKAMYDHGILRKCGKAAKPVLLKRGFGTTLQEFVQSAEFILSGGNDDVMLCERGIRTFETKTRFTLDLCGIAFLKEKTNLPVVLDPSHAMGYSYGVADLARACTAMGIDGLLIETHPNPKVAKSDAAQQLDFDQFRALHKSLLPITQAIGRSIV